MKAAETGPPQVSVCIPALDEADAIGRQLAALARQRTQRRFEVVVADNGSTDGTADVARRHADRLDLRVVDAGRAPGANVARNEAALAARGRLLLFCDADDEVGPDWVEAMAAALESGHAFVAGHTEVRSARDGRLLEERTTYPELGMFTAPLGGNMGVTREAALAVGLFDEGWLGGHEEVVFAYDLWRTGVEAAVADERAHLTYLKDDPWLGRMLRHQLRQGRRSGWFRRRLVADGHPVDPPPDPVAIAKIVVVATARHGLRYGLRRLAWRVGEAVGWRQDPPARRRAPSLQGRVG